MIKIKTLEDIQLLNENIELECKLANGRDGKGELPKKTFWETYSAFANTNGGVILLGVKETKDHTFEVEGINDIQKVLDEFYSGLENRHTISANIINEKDVEVITIDSKTIISIKVSRAPRHIKPVYRTSNPMDGTYQRVHSSDSLCSADIVKRMLAEQIEDSRDDKLLDNYDMNDIDSNTLQAYRQLYSFRDPENERNQYDNIEFLRSIGGWKKDRQTSKEGLTVAGLLMFGKMISIQEEFPNFMLDYQERPEARTENRWIDRVTLDGKWSGNLFDFYTKVIKKLTADLKVPFKLEGDKRQDRTPIHDALREAFVNTLVHADYSGKASVLIVKRPDMFGFRNPGLMRISVEQAISGYEHDCRNEKLHQMFHFIGLGERAGSGIPNIFKWWDEKHWRPPHLYEKLEPYDQTLLELRMADLISSDILNELKFIFDSDLEHLDNTQRLILSTALVEQTVTHGRMREICNEHNHDLSQTLHKMVQDGILYSNGYGQGTVYYLPNQKLVTPDDVFSSTISSNINLKKISSGGSEISSGGSEVSSGGYKIEGLNFSIYENETQLEELTKKEIETILSPYATKKRLPKAQLEEIVKKICANRYLTLNLLSKLLDKSEDYIRKDVLNPMVANQELFRAFPQTPNDPRQAYTSTRER
jgi:predicted HTH transcriptional regulator